MVSSALLAWTSQKRSYLQKFSCAPYLCVPNLSKLRTKFSLMPPWGKPPSLVSRDKLREPLPCQIIHLPQTFRWTVAEIFNRHFWILFHFVFPAQLVWTGPRCLSSVTGLGFSIALFLRDVLLYWPLTTQKPFGEKPTHLSLAFLIRAQAPVSFTGSSLSCFSVCPRKA